MSKFKHFCVLVVCAFVFGSCVNENSFGGVTLTIKAKKENSGFAFVGKMQAEPGCVVDDFGILYSTMPNITYENAQKLDIANLHGEKYKVHLPIVSPNVTYYYTTYIRVGGVYSYGKLGKFESKSKKLDTSHIKDLSLAGTANCYVVSESGLYRFRAVKGNSGEIVQNVASCEILWETYGDDVVPDRGSLVRSVSYQDGYVILEVPQPYTEGNALVALKNASGKVLWSWHIWLTEQPQGQTYYNGAGVMMDRNLGATTTTRGDSRNYGLLYQWGRKDPFLSADSKISTTPAASTIMWPEEVKSDSYTGTIEYSVSHPTTFIAENSSNLDWYYTGSSRTDNTRWQSRKTMYDPCPAGWRVPDGGEYGVWERAFGFYVEYFDLYDRSKAGMDFSTVLGSSHDIWYPSAGWRKSVDGNLSNAGVYGRYWTCTPKGKSAYFMVFASNDLRPSHSYDRGGARSVRCQREN